MKWYESFLMADVNSRHQQVEALESHKKVPNYACQFVKMRAGCP